MTTTNKILMSEARVSLKDKWGLAVGTNVVFFLISSIGNEVAIVIGGPMQLGLSIFSLNLARKKKAEFSQLFDGFKDFGNALLAYILMAVFVFLWLLLLIVPGIIAAIAYSQTFFILADNKGLAGNEALKQSKAMMHGHKWRYFCLCLRFTGWFILSILTLGIGFLWLAPYFNVSLANFYDDLKKS